MIRNLGLAAVLALAGCQTTEQKDPAYTPELKAYITCNALASIVVARQQGDPLTLAMAAASVCAREEAALRLAVYDAVDRDPARATRILNIFKEGATERNMGRIVRERAGMR